MAKKDDKSGLDLLREPFPANLVSKLPKPTKQQTEAVKKDFKAGIRCKVCGAWHHPKVVHLDYVGHAALTDRLLDCDPEWNWEPMSTDSNGAPMIDDNGGIWIKLTVCGVTRIGYGHPDGKTGGNAIKETIGDALRNAAMRFGAALDLWHKGDLHPDEGDDTGGNGTGAREADPQDATGTQKDDTDVRIKMIRKEITGYLNSEWLAFDKKSAGEKFMEENPSLARLEKFRDSLLKLYGEWQEAERQKKEEDDKKPENPVEKPSEKMWRCIVCNSQSKGGSDDATKDWKLISTQQTGPHMGLCPKHAGETADSLRDQAEAAKEKGKTADVTRYEKAAGILADMKGQ
jgi:hypothetical protein